MRAPVSHRFVRLLAAGGLAGALLLPALAVPARAADEKLVLRVGATQEAESLNPFAIITVSGYEVFQLTYNLMVDFGPNLEPVPGFADKWERAADGKSWTFHIREGMKWSDGTPATAQDACYSWGIALAAIGRRLHRRGLPRPGPQRRRGHEDRVPRRPDPDRLHGRRHRPDPPDLHPDPAQAHLGDTDYKEIGRGDVRRRRSSAPAPTSRWSSRPSQFVRFERNPYYWGTQGAADEVVIQFFKSDDTMVQALKAGEIDYARGPNPDQLKALANEPGMKTVAGESNGWTQLAFNTLRHGDRQDDQGRRPLHDRAEGRRVPRCAGLRDRQGPARRARPRRLRRCRAPPSSRRSSTKWHVDPTNPRTFDIELAKQKLDAAGYKLDGSGARLDKEGKPISLRLYFPDTDDAVHEGRRVRPGLVRQARESR